MAVRIFLIFFRVGAFTFGGGIAMISMLRHELIVGKGWTNDDDFAEDFALATSVPGAWVVNFALIHGYRLRGVWGAALAFLGVVLPSFVVIVVIAAFFFPWFNHPFAAAFLRGAAASVAGLLAHTAFTMSKPVLRKSLYLAAAVAAAALALIPSLNPILALLIVSAIVFFLLINSKKLRKKYVEDGQ
ncbi:MAG: chromate transporter [Chitinispirillales bacterium]|jgi:chromate transporter|nr:chromate transporter [Chitinispirillales bacterium]